MKCDIFMHMQGARCSYLKYAKFTGVVSQSDAVLTIFLTPDL